MLKATWFVSQITFFLTLAFPLTSPAQVLWSEPVQLTDSIGFGDARASLHGDNIYVVGGASPVKFYYVRSTDGGITWSHAITHAPADTFEGCSQPDVVCSRGRVHLAWLAKPHGQLREQVYHISSSNGGETWTPPAPGVSAR
ncbi:MAG: hypothetical protein A2W25_06125 [candidate division Zixibacteria bacterium RBG_16_53_22]|nr:MAG: hypothetical protein A2W25_06125 [candidate division Zixibacteria bacterium RBG_16_53_22]